MSSIDQTAGAVILVVEDEELSRLIISDYLTDDGFVVVESANADQALRILDSRNDVQVVVLDVEMPGAMDGIALAHRIHERWPGIGLLIISGKAIPKTTQLPSGAGFLPKPYFGPSIIGRVRALISPRPQR